MVGHQNGERRKIYAGRVVGILAGILIFVGITKILNQMYVGYSSYSDAWYRTLWQQFYAHEGEIDNLFLGSSHVYCDVDPSILDQLTQQCNFNLASPNQPLNGSYYLLREADRLNELSHVYLEMSYMSVYQDKRISEYLRNWSNTDYMKWSFNKVAYLGSIGEPDQYINILFPYTRYRKYVGRWDYISKVLSRKQEEDYRNYQWDRVWGDEDGQLMICEQGFSSSAKIYNNEDKFFRQEADLTGFSLGGKSERYCRAIIEYCRKRDIPVTLYVAPIYDLELISTQDYDDYIMVLRKLAAEYKLTLYDFNLAKEEYLSLQDSDRFRDTGHLNSTGASLFTPFFYQIVSGDEADNQKYFHDSYEEKLQSLAPTVYGTYYTDYDDELTEQKQTRKVCVASNRDSEMEYKIILTPDEGEPYTVQDFDVNKVFYVAPEEEGTCMIAARMKVCPNEVVQTLEIRY